MKVSSRPHSTTKNKNSNKYNYLTELFDTQERNRILSISVFEIVVQI